ncbi:MAG TPA: adenylate/guanylate cyclase domain-containing protein [Bacteroidota bacterium]
MNINSNRKLKATVILIVASFVSSYLLFWLFPNIFEPWNAQAVDQLFVFRSHSKSLQPAYDSTVVHVDLSDASMEKLGSFYPSRFHFGQVTKNLGEMGVAAQIWDFIFAARSANPEEDSAFIEGTRQAGNVYYGVAFELLERKGPQNPGRVSKDRLAYLDTTKWNVVVDGKADDFYTGVRPLTTFTRLASASRGVGFLSIKFDRDGAFRRAPLLVRYENGFYPSLPFRAVCDYLGVPPENIVVRPRRSVTLKDAHRPGQQPHDIVIPIDEYGQMIINFVGPWERMRHIDFTDVYRASDSRADLEDMSDELRGTFVVVSQVSTGSSDIAPVPTDNNFPLSGLHANVANTILTENFLTEPSAFQLFLADFLLALVAFLLAYRLPSRWLSAAAISLVLLYGAAAAVLFLYGNIILNVIRPSMIIVIGIFSTLAYRYINEEKEKMSLRRSFEAYFPPSVVRKIMANPDMITAAGQKKELTIMFTDIKSFTTYSSTMAPDQIQKMLNEYFGAMVDIVFKYEGTVDKFIGDGLMVFFGDPEPQPDHAVRCVRAAIEMQLKCRELKLRWEKEGLFPLRVRVGINSGPVVVGNMGSSRRLSYTALGSDVNLAQRLESNAPVEGILISHRTNDLLAGQIRTIPHDPILVKGLTEPVLVYEVPVA